MRAAVSLALQWPGLAPSALAAVRVAHLCVAAAAAARAARVRAGTSAATGSLRTDAPSAPAPLSPTEPLALFRDAIVDLTVDLLAGTGCALPVMEWHTGLADEAEEGGLLGGPRGVLSIQRRFLSTLALAVEAPISLPFAVALGRLVRAVQAGLRATGSLEQLRQLTLIPLQRDRLVEMLRAAAAAYSSSGSSAPLPPAAVRVQGQGHSADALHMATDAELRLEFQGLLAAMDQPET